MEEERYYVKVILMTDDHNIEEYVRMFRSYQEGSSAYEKLEEELCDY